MTFKMGFEKGGQQKKKRTEERRKKTVSGTRRYKHANILKYNDEINLSVLIYWKQGVLYPMYV